MNLFLLMLMAGFLTLVSNRKHLLNMLFSLEFIMLSLFFGVMLILSKNVLENYFSFYFLSFVACKGALGLSVLISIMRTHGNDYFLLYNSVQW